MSLMGTIPEQSVEYAGGAEFSPLACVARCLAGEQAAYSQLHAHFAGRVAAYFVRSGFFSADAEDLTQEVFVRAFKSLRTFDATRGGVGNWLLAIARNVARRSWSRSTKADDFDPDLAAEVLADHSAAGPSLEDREELDALRDCMVGLHSGLAAVIRLRYVEGCTTRGIAAATGLPESTVRLRLSEAAKQLELCLKGKGFLKD